MEREKKKKITLGELAQNGRPAVLISTSVAAFANAARVTSLSSHCTEMIYTGEDGACEPRTLRGAALPTRPHSAAVNSQMGLVKTQPHLGASP